MEKITFNNVLPQVFANVDDMKSAVWCSELVFEKGQTYLIEADSGKGKSTFCSYIMGYRRDYSGTISFDDRDVKSLSVAEWIDIRKYHVAHLFQELRLFPELTALENIEIKNNLTQHFTLHQIKNMFSKLGIADKLASKVGLMSFGQQQRVAMIRALAQPFDFICVDEPISHLDDDNANVMGELMIEEAKQQGAGVIVTSIGKHMDIQYNKILWL